MTLELIGGIQIIQIIGFVIAVFYLYRLIVKQKESLIEFQKSEIVSLNNKISKMGSDPLAENLQNRIHIYEKELINLKEDKNLNIKLITGKEKELDRLISLQEDLKSHLLKSSGLTFSMFCPQCDEPTLKSVETHTQLRGGKKSISQAEYDCGHKITDNQVMADCKNVS